MLVDLMKDPWVDKSVSKLRKSITFSYQKYSNNKGENEIFSALLPNNNICLFLKKKEKIENTSALHS